MKYLHNSWFWQGWHQGTLMGFWGWSVPPLATLLFIPKYEKCLVKANSYFPYCSRHMDAEGMNWPLSCQWKLNGNTSRILSYTKICSSHFTFSTPILFSFFNYFQLFSQSVLSQWTQNFLHRCSTLKIRKTPKACWQNNQLKVAIEMKYQLIE